MLSEDKVKIDSLEFPNSMLGDLARNLLHDGFRVYVFQEHEISQIFFEDKNNKIGSCSDRYGYLAYSTEHVPDRTNGTGFVIDQASTDVTTETASKACIIGIPHWASGHSVFKWSCFNRKASACKIITYRELEP